jgi:hypothetical protein
MFLSCHSRMRSTTSAIKNIVSGSPLLLAMDRESFYGLIGRRRRDLE